MSKKGGGGGEGRRGSWEKVIWRIDANEFALAATFSISITRERPEFYLKLGNPTFSLRPFFFLKRFLRFVSSSLSFFFFFFQSFISVR